LYFPSESVVNERGRWVARTAEVGLLRRSARVTLLIMLRSRSRSFKAKTKPGKSIL
jgi:hypothetical protein